jgi:hypothetical protein
VGVRVAEQLLGDIYRARYLVLLDQEERILNRMLELSKVGALAGSTEGEHLLNDLEEVNRLQGHLSQKMVDAVAIDYRDLAQLGARIVEELTRARQERRKRRGNAP